MKQWRLSGVLLCLVLIGSSVSIGSIASVGDGASLPEKAGKKLLAPVDTQKIFPTTALEEKQAQEAVLVKEKKQLEETSKQFAVRTNSDIEWIKGRLDAVTEKLRRDPEDDFSNRKLKLLNERLQVIKNEQQSREQKIAVLDENILLLQGYLKDPTFGHYRRELNVDDRDVYSLEDLQNLSQLMVEKEKNITQLLEQEKNSDTEIESRKQAALTALEACRKKREEQDTLSKAQRETFDFGTQQRAELLKLEEQLDNNKNQRDTLRLEEIEHKKALIQTKLFIERLQLDVIKETFAKVKPAIKVSEADIALARDEFAKKQQQSLARKETYNEQLEKIVQELGHKEKAVHELSVAYAVPINTDLEEWSRFPKESVTGFTHLLEVASANDAALLAQRTKDMYEAQISLEDETLHLESVHIDIKESFHKITTHKFASEEETKQERKKYEVLRSEAKATLSSKVEQKNNAQDRLTRQKKALINIKEIRQKLHEKKGTLFKDHEDEYADCLQHLNSAQDSIGSQIDMTNTVITLSSDVIAILTSMIKQIDFIAVELELTTVWQRSKYAITWDGVQNILPHIELFIRDLRSGIPTIRPQELLTQLRHQTQFSHLSFLFILYFIALLIVATLGKWLLPRLASFFVHISNRYRGLRFATLLMALMCSFAAAYSGMITLFVMILVFFQVYYITDNHVYIILYLAAIPYLLYLAYGFMNHFAQFNMRHLYIFIAKDFQHRFVMVASTLLYATIAIFFFREAFLLGAYHKSELPTILLAVNFIIFQISLIFLIAKEHILSIIPTTGELWKWVAFQVDRFYYLILMVAITVIVMSNPYVGFGKLVLFVLTRLVYTVVLLRLLLWINSLFKRGLSYVFFSRGTEEFMKERFAYAKTLYGVCAIALLFFFMVILVIGGAKIWGWPETFANISHWSDIMAWLKEPILFEKTQHEISIFSLLKILFFVLLGFLIAFWIDRFIIERIFDALVVEPGVQNTISSIARYVIVILSIIAGFQSVGLGELVLALIGALILGIGWVIKDPLGDFIAYFIILVQRPVKIGDFIRLEEGTEGVVRKITPRSVVLRRRNSVTIILPNTTIINKPLVNWNYVRGFVAFEDIRITIAYKEDPARAKMLLLQVLDENSFILKTPTPIVRLENFTEQGFDFLVRGFLSSNYTLDSWEIASDIRLAIVKKLRDNGIQIAVPTRVVVNKELFVRDENPTT